jgi:hypothetical protein
MSELSDREAFAHFLEAIGNAIDMATRMAKPHQNGVILLGSKRADFMGFIQAMRNARDAARGVALTRRDYESASKYQWVKTARICQNMADEAERILTQTKTPPSWAKVSKNLEQVRAMARDQFSRSVAHVKMQG